MTRNGTDNEQWELAQQLVAYQDSLSAPSVGHDSGKQPVIDRLMPSLLPLVGKVGFCSLLARALTLAKRQSPVLRGVRVREDCTLEGFPEDASAAVAIVIAHLIGLMTTFMGETLTLRLLRNAWPEFPALQQGSVEQNKHE